MEKKTKQFDIVSIFYTFIIKRIRTCEHRIQIAIVSISCQKSLKLQQKIGKFEKSVRFISNTIQPFENLEGREIDENVII